MTESADRAPGRRRRRRPTRAQGGAAPAAVQPTAEPAAADPVAPAKPTRRRRNARDTGTERGLRDLVGAGRSQIGVSGALRARDVNRPTEEDLAEAELDVAVIRRHWKPTKPD